MANFREENPFLIYYTNFFGLHMTIPESLMPRKWLKGFVNVWTKIPITVLPAYILWDIRALIFDEMTVLVRFAMVRKVFVFCGFFLKNVLFYWNRQKIEKLIDLWDGSFLESFYPEEDLINRQKNQKRNRTIVRAAIGLAVAAALSYSVPAYFSKQKVFLHPSGIVVPSRSPEFEIAVTFDVCASLSCISAAAFDCILVVFLSQVRSKLEFLQERLAHVINEVVIDDEGRLIARRITPREDGFYEEREIQSEEFLRNMANADNNMRIWVHHHQEVISFFEETAKAYSSIATFELGYIVVYTGLTALNIVQVKINLVALGIALVASSNLMSLFLWCKIAGDLRDIDTFGEGFERAWFLFPRKLKSAFSLIIMRSKKPLTLYGFSLYAVSLVTFFEILKLTYQFFAFMVQVTTDEQN